MSARVASAVFSISERCRKSLYSICVSIASFSSRTVSLRRQPRSKGEDEDEDEGESEDEGERERESEDEDEDEGVYLGDRSYMHCWIK